MIHQPMMMMSPGYSQSMMYMQPQPIMAQPIMPQPIMPQPVISQPIISQHSQPIMSRFGGGGYPGSIRNPEKAPVCCRCCDCCNCKYMTCAGFWAGFNLIQVIIAFIICGVNRNSPLIFNRAYDSTSSVQPTREYVAYNLPACLNIIILFGSEEADIKLGMQLAMLVIYAFGSVAFAVAVFFTSMNQKLRILFLNLYVGTCACFPLAYLIPMIMDLSACPDFAWFIVLFYGGFLLWTGILIFFDIRIPLVFKKWMKESGGNIAVVTPMPNTGPSTNLLETMDNKSGSGDSQ